MAGLTPALTRGAAKLAGPWNVTQARFCGLAPLPGEGASPARSRGLRAAQIWLPLSSNGSSVKVGTGTWLGHREECGHGADIQGGPSNTWAQDGSFPDGAAF